MGGLGKVWYNTPRVIPQTIVSLVALRRNPVGIICIKGESVHTG